MQTNNEYTLTHFSAKTGVKELIQSYRDTEKFIAYCEKCNRYKACWACPPFDFNTDEYLTVYPVAHIIGTKITLSKEIINAYQGKEKCTQISYKIIQKVREDLDKKLLNLEQQHPESKAFFAGTCHICPIGSCKKIIGYPCISPEKIRPSLEALGFDVSKISAEVLNIEMQWSHNGILPEYFTLVSGFLTKEEITSII